MLLGYQRQELDKCLFWNWLRVRESLVVDVVVFFWEGWRISKISMLRVIPLQPDHAPPQRSLTSLKMARENITIILLHLIQYISLILSQYSSKVLASTPHPEHQSHLLNWPGRPQCHRRPWSTQRRLPLVGQQILQTQAGTMLEYFQGCQYKRWIQDFGFYIGALLVEISCKIIIFEPFYIKNLERKNCWVKTMIWICFSILHLSCHC